MEIGQPIAEVTGGSGEIHGSKGSELVDCLPKAMPTGGFELVTNTMLGIARFEQGEADAALAALKAAKGPEEVKEAFGVASEERREANIALAAAAQAGAGKVAKAATAKPMKLG